MAAQGGGGPGSGSTADTLERIARAKAEAEDLKRRIEAAKARLNNGSLSDSPPSYTPLPPKLVNRLVLRGHFGKICALDWAGAPTTLLSASQDGKLLLWNALAGAKTEAIKLSSVWVMTCAFEKDTDGLVACGGLDNTCSVYSVGSSGGGSAVELQHHDGYLSSCRFLGPGSMVTASGDSTCVLWDVTGPDPVQIFADHASDTLCVDVCPTNASVFVSGSCDQTAKVWDTRSGKCVQTFVGHDSDINSVRFMRNGLAFATGSEDATCKLFDLRSYARLNEFAYSQFNMSVVSVDFSASGRLLFGGYDDYRSYAWDTLTENPSAPVQMLEYHRNRVACVGVNTPGTAVATGSWDAELSIWA